MSKLPDLPEPISFPHVTAIDFRSMALKHLPDGFLKAFPNLMSVEISHCKLTRFPAMTGLRERLRILDLSDNKIHLDAEQVDLINGCTALQYLNLSRNPLQLPFSVTGMPRLRTLILRDDKLVLMPEGVESHQKLYELDMIGNNLKALPAGFSDSPLWDKGRVRFESKDLNLSVTQVRSWYRPDDGEVPARLLWLDRIDAKDRDKMAQSWHFLVSDPESREFVLVLERLVQSEDFAHDDTARDLAYRIFDMLHDMEEDESLCAHVLAMAQEPNCGDNALLRFVDLEIWKLAWDAEHGEYEIDPEAGLLHLGGQLWRQNALQDFAKQFAKSMPGAVDEVEVVLAFRVRLYDDLKLPGHRSRIRFTRAVGNIEAGVENARRTILAGQDEETISLWLLRLPFWSKYLEHAYGSRLKLPREFRKQEQELTRLGGDTQQLEALHEQAKQWWFTQQQAVTKEAMRRVTPAWHAPLPVELD